jgi:serine phosphatase RsbU (regulator of sigma subunit)
LSRSAKSAPPEFATPGATAPGNRASDSRLLRFVLSLAREGPSRRWRILIVSLAFEAICMVALAQVHQTRHILGIPGSLMALTAAVAGIVGGTVVGASTALLGGAVYAATVAGLGTKGSWPATIISIALWTMIGLLSAVLADALRDQAARRREAAVSLAESRATEAAHAETAALHLSLEAGLLPHTTLEHPVLRVATAYRPSEARLRLGGDFFDVLNLDDDRLALIIGDVSGHGPQAAALGAGLRSGWQALTLSGAAPEATLLSLNDQLALSAAGDDLFATVCCAWLDPRAGRGDFISAGHPAPILITDGIAELDFEHMVPLGVSRAVRWQPTSVALPGAWTLVFYTDGLIEGRAAPGSRERFGLRRLQARLDGSGTNLIDAHVLEGLVDEIEVANGGPFGDDVAVVCIGKPGEDASTP